MPGVFLRLHSNRDQIALPYSSLLNANLSLDEATLELSFATHHVTLTGRHLAEIYTAVAEAEARVIAVASNNLADEARLPPFRSLVSAIRIEPLESGEKRRR